MNELELSERCRQGDNRARKELYEQYAGRMLGVCLRYAGDRDMAQDLVHDGFLKIFDSFDKFTWRGEGSLRAWMERVMVNTRIHHYTLHPCSQRAFTPPGKLVEGVENLQETVVYQVLCHVPVSGITKTDTKHAPCVLLIKFFAGTIISLPATFRQL